MVETLLKLHCKSLQPQSPTNFRGYDVGYRANARIMQTTTHSLHVSTTSRFKWNTSAETSYLRFPLLPAPLFLSITSLQPWFVSIATGWCLPRVPFLCYWRQFLRRASILGITWPYTGVHRIVLESEQKTVAEVVAGQNSYGQEDGHLAQQRLASYCASTTTDHQTLSNVS